MMPRPTSSDSVRGAAAGRVARSTAPAARRTVSAALGGGGGGGGAPAGSAAGAPGLTGEAGASSAIRRSESQLTQRILLRGSHRSGSLVGARGGGQGGGGRA